jgi:2,3-bisphosphoglycerate-dependent phosphoglycerate mutase
MGVLVLLRHGQSQWNLENRFSGWADVDLTSVGVEEAHRAGILMREAGLVFDTALTSVLRRAVKTLWIALEESDQVWVPEIKDWRINERHYGALQGLSKSETAVQSGAKTVYAWRRGYAVRPPALDWDDSRHPRFDPRYTKIDPAVLPATESLKDTLERVLPCWFDTIEPRVRAGERVLVAAHGNSLRALVKFLDGISDEDIPDLNIPTGIPLVYTFDADMNLVRREYLAAPETVAKATEGVRRDLERLKGEESSE